MTKIKYYIIAFILSVLTFHSFGQNYHAIDSLKKALKTAATESRIEILNQIGWEYRLSKPDTTIHLTNNLPYSLSVEFSRSGGMLRKNLARIQQILRGQKSKFLGEKWINFLIFGGPKNQIFSEIF